MVEKVYNKAITPINIQYETDNDISIHQSILNTVEGCIFSIPHILDNCNDIKINNYSCLFLTNNQSLSSNVICGEVKPANTYITYLSSSNGYLQTPPLEIGTISTNLNYSKDVDEMCMFKIKFNEDLLTCEIQYYDASIEQLYYVDVFNNKMQSLSSQPYTFIYDKQSHTLTLCDGIATITSFNVSPLYENISYTNATMKYNNTSGDVLTSYNDHKNNLLLNIQYTSTENDTFLCNILNIHNQKTYTQHDGWKNYWKTNNFNHIATIQTGTTQEHGNTNIYNINEFYTSDITILPGINEFVTPDNLYPYNRININDTTFSKTGAFGSKSPVTSDRIFTERYTSDDYILLCTWLSSNTNGDGIWLDRYYNPTLFTFQEALTTKADEAIYNVYNSNTHLYDSGFFDQQSNVCITPSQLIKYHHITNDDLQSYISEKAVFALSGITFKDVNGTNILQSDSFTLTGDMYGSIYINNKLQVKNNFAISVDVDIYDWNELECYDIFTTQSNTYGIRLYKDVNITPTLLTWEHVSDSKTIVYIFNTKFDKIDEWEINGNVVNICRDDNLTYVVAQLTDCVKLYNIFGGLLYIFKRDSYTVKAAYCTTKDVYICYSDLSVYKYSMYDFSKDNTYNKAISFADADSIGSMIIENNQCVISPHILNRISYVPSYGYLYITNAYTDDSNNNSNGTIPAINNMLLLNSQITDNILLTPADTKYIDIRSNTYTDDINDKYWTQHYLYDFTVANDILYTVNTSALIRCNIDRTDITHFKLPTHTDGNNSKVYIYATNEIEHYKYVTNIWILLASDINNGIEMYQFKNDTFTKIKTIYNISDHNLYNLSGKKYLPKNKSKLMLDISFKSDDNRIIKYTKPVDTILPGPHTLLFNVNTVLGYCHLYVDEDKKCDISFTNQHTFTNDIMQNKIILGNTLLYNGGDLASYINSNDYLLKNVTIGNVYMFDSPLSEEDIRINILKNKTIPPIILNLPCGQRCEVSKIDKVYKQTMPGFKSTSFDVVVKNLKLSEKNQVLLTKSIQNYINSQLPTTTVLDTITYKNY